VRRRREFLNKSLFLYLAVALVVALVLPSYILSRNSIDSADETLRTRQQGPIGRYVAASNEIGAYETAQTRAEKRFDASELALMPGRVSTEVLTEFSKRRPDTVRISSVELLTDTNNPTSDKNFKPRTLLKFTFFIEKRGGNNPINVSNELRAILAELPGVLKGTDGGVIPGPQEDIDSGLMVTQTVVLDLTLEQEGTQ